MVRESIPDGLTEQPIFVEFTAKIEHCGGAG
jgi:hypothetical protein